MHDKQTINRLSNEEEKKEFEKERETESESESEFRRKTENQGSKLPASKKPAHLQQGK